MFVLLHLCIFCVRISITPCLSYSHLRLAERTACVYDLPFQIFVLEYKNVNAVQVEELKRGGSDIVVNNSNRIEYIHLMADYRLNRQV